MKLATNGLFTMRVAIAENVFKVRCQKQAEALVVVVVYWQKCGQRNRDTTRIAVKNKT